MGQDVRNDSRVCRTPPGPPRDLNLYFRPNPIIVAVSLTFILMTSGLVYYWMLPKALPIIDEEHIEPTIYAYIAIDGDANFADTALREGWPGDGSPENPYIIESLDIDMGGAVGHCISIRNTRVNFTISNCNLTGTGPDFLYPGAGIRLENVINGELFNNNCNTNHVGILLIDSHSNTVFNNICYNNSYGIRVEESHSNTVVNNTCNGNIVIFGDETPPFSGWGISLAGSNSNIVANNSCFSNEVGMILWESQSNTVISNTCNNNRIGIYLYESYFNTVEYNTFLGNTEHDIFEEP
ncbi:MAG: right-handed parallel beta-helix repeat-containing protein [Candidatus Thorarchaeota archaeon]